MSFFAVSTIAFVLSTLPGFRGRRQLFPILKWRLKRVSAVRSGSDLTPARASQITCFQKESLWMLKSLWIYFLYASVILIFPVLSWLGFLMRGGGSHLPL